MAGVWERWTPPEAQASLGDFGARRDDPAAVETFAVVTAESNGLVSKLYNRMAVVLAPGEEETWLAGDPDEAAALCGPHPDDELRAYPVSTRANSPVNDAPNLVEEVEG